MVWAKVFKSWWKQSGDRFWWVQESIAHQGGMIPLTFCNLTSASLLSLMCDSHSLQNDSFKFLIRTRITVLVCMSSERVCLYWQVAQILTNSISSFKFTILMVNIFNYVKHVTTYILCSWGNGHIDFEELRTVLESCMGESALQFTDDQLDELTNTLLEDADADNSGSVTFEELQSALSRHPGLVENLTFRLVTLPSILWVCYIITFTHNHNYDATILSAANWFQLRKRSHQRRRIKRIPHWMRLSYLRNNLTWVIWLSLYFVVNIILFVEAAVRHRNKVTR